jgi:hypothetical protein
MARGTERGDHHEDGEHHRPQVSEDGGERVVHMAIIAARWKGSLPPTAQAYARALRLWRRLPGAIVTAATDLGDAADVRPPDGTGRPGEKQP